MKAVKRKKLNKAINFNILIGLPYILITLLLVILPLGIMLLYSFTKSSNGFDITFTLSHYKNFFLEPQFVKTMLKSLWVSLLTTMICLIIGYPLAYIISRVKGHLQVLFILLINAPMWINMLLRVRSIQQLLNIFSPTLYETEFALILGMVYLFLPFMVLPIYTVLSKMDENYFEGAADLGANRFQTIYRVIIPLSLSGIISGIIMVFLPAATTLVVPQYLGKNVHFIGNVIESSITQQINGGYGYGAAIALVLSLIIMLMVFGMKKVDKYQGGQNETTE